MEKHIYLHTKPENAEILKQCSGFVKTSDYSVLLKSRQHKHEYGYIKDGDTYLHILLGRMKCKICPWCGSLPELAIDRNKTPATGLHPCKVPVYMKCKSCGSQGPVSLIDERYLEDEFLDFIVSRVEDRNESILMWYDFFDNPMESKDNE